MNRRGMCWFLFFFVLLEDRLSVSKLGWLVGPCVENRVMFQSAFLMMQKLHCTVSMNCTTYKITNWHGNCSQHSGKTGFGCLLLPSTKGAGFNLLLFAIFDDNRRNAMPHYRTHTHTNAHTHSTSELINLLYIRTAKYNGQSNECYCIWAIKMQINWFVWSKQASDSIDTPANLTSENPIQMHSMTHSV